MKGTVKNKFDEALDFIIKVYDTPGNQEIVKRAMLLKKKKEVAAVELNQIRKLLDDWFPVAAYSGKESVKIKGIQKLVDPIRKALEALDTTGTVKRLNKDIQILYKFLPAAKNAADDTVINKLLWNNLLRTAGLGGPAVLLGGPAQTAAGVAALLGFIADLPAAAPALGTQLAQFLNSIGAGQAAPQINQLIKSITTKSAVDVGG